jgi:hypothetical protein
VFQWGQHRFSWSRHRFTPEKWLRGHPSLRARHTQTHDSEKTKRQCWPDREHDLHSYSDLIGGIQELHDQRLSSFESFRHGAKHRDLSVDPSMFARTLMKTSALEASNPRDYIYAILGITVFPAKPMSVMDWVTVREFEDTPFLPIDYSADLSTILCTLTWAILMTDGLQPLVHIMPQHKSFASTGNSSLPSWVIDYKHKSNRPRMRSTR